MIVAELDEAFLNTVRARIEAALYLTVNTDR